MTVATYAAAKLLRVLPRQGITRVMGRLADVQLHPAVADAVVGLYVRAYQVDLPLHEGTYKWSGGNSVTTFDSTVVEVQTDAGITGYGEVCPLGPAYLPAYAAGVLGAGALALR